MVEERKTPYDNLKELYSKIKFYSQISRKIQQGGFFEGLDELVVKIISESDLDDEDKNYKIKKIHEDKIVDPNALNPWVKYRGKKAEKDYDNYSKNNLEEILKSTPEKKLKEVLLLVYPEKDEKDIAKKYKENYRLHKQASEMSHILNVYQNPKVPESEKKKLEQIMDEEVLKYFKDKYGEDEDLFEAITAFVKYAPKYSSEKYFKLTEKKADELYEKLNGNFADYFREILGDEKIPVLYTSIFEKELSEKKDSYE